ncbi:DsbE family thiol:disulfide interchange protein, partial [Herbaspirillum sp. HC18]
MSDQSSPAPPQRRTFLMVLPLIAFLALALLFWFRLGSG